MYMYNVYRCGSLFLFQITVSLRLIQKVCRVIDKSVSMIFIGTTMKSEYWCNGHTFWKSPVFRRIEKAQNSDGIIRDEIPFVPIFLPLVPKDFRIAFVFGKIPLL